MSPESWMLAELHDADRAALERLAEVREYAPEETLINGGEHPRALLQLLSGTASIRMERHGRLVEVSQVSEGALLGEMSLVSGDPASATVAAVTPCRVARVSAESLRNHGEADPGFTARLYQGLARVIGNRLRQMNSALVDRSEAEAFTPISWSDTLASILAIELPPLVLEWIDRYSTVGHRGMFLWKWCWRGLEETELTSVPEAWREHTRSTKLVSIILNVLLDDLADRPGEEERFQVAIGLLSPHGEPSSAAVRADPHDPYLALITQIWAFLGERAQELAGWRHHAALWDFDYRQVFTAMRYASLINRYPGLDNLAENRAYLPHNLNIMPFAILDLMASQVDRAELGMVREAVYHAQCWGQIGNMLATWRREVPDRDFTSRVFALALDLGVLSRSDLETLPAEELLARLEASSVEAQLLAECREHRNRLTTVAQRCRSFDLTAYARGVETFFAMNLAARGFI